MQILQLGQIIRYHIQFLFSFQCIEQNLAIINPSYLEKVERHCQEPSLRVIANRLLDDDDIQFAFDTIENVSSDILSAL